MDSLRSPIEITTVFFVLSIGFYIFLFWRSQAKAQAQPARERRLNDRRQVSLRAHSTKSAVPIPSHNKPVDLEAIAIDQLWDEDGTNSKMTSH